MSTCTITLSRNITYDLFKNKFIANNVAIPKEEFMRYIKGIFTNRERLIENFIKPIDKVNILNELKTFILDNYDTAKPYSYADAFLIKSLPYQRYVFSSISIKEMMDNLPTKRLCVDGISVVRRKFDNEGKRLADVTYDNVYETYEVDITKLGANQKAYTVKAWCTSTNKEHWLWIDPKFKDDPLEAIASTFVIYEKLLNVMLENNYEMHRQGDILICESDIDIDIKPNDKTVVLTKEQYFKLLVCES